MVDKGCNLDKGVLSPRHNQEAALILRRASQALGETTSPLEIPCLNYAHPQGCPFFRQELATFLTSIYGEDVNSDCLLSTAGATQALCMVVSHFLPPQAPIFVVEPGFLNADKLLQDMFRDIVPVSVDDDGICVDELESLLQANEARLLPKVKVQGRTPFRAMVYMGTVFANPTGEVLAPERCRRLLQLGLRYDLLLFSDDVYNLVPLSADDTSPPPRLSSYCANETERDLVMSNGSFSKILSPGVRLGWLETTRRNIDIMNNWAMLRAAGPPNHYMSQLVAMAMKHGWVQSQLAGIRLHAKNNIDIAIRVLNDSLPAGASVRAPKGGFFLWVRLPENIDSEKLGRTLRENHNIQTRPGPSCSFAGQFKNYIRLAMAGCDTESVHDAIQTFCDVIREMAA